MYLEPQTLWLSLTLACKGHRAQLHPSPEQDPVYIGRGAEANAQPGGGQPGFSVQVSLLKVFSCLSAGMGGKTSRRGCTTVEQMVILVHNQEHLPLWHMLAAFHQHAYQPALASK
jgi:hypothetical protein